MGHEPTIARREPTFSVDFAHPISIGASSRCHVLQGESSITSLNVFKCTWLDGDRMEPSPCDWHALHDRICIHHALFYHMSCKEEFPREHSPTRTKWGELSSIKCGRLKRICVTAPNLLLGPTNPWAHHLPSQSCSHHVAPPGRPRGLTWPCHASAPPPRHLGAAWARAALLRGLACPVVSTWVSRHVSLRFLQKITHFCLFKFRKWNQ